MDTVKMTNIPLAERLRPRTIDEYVGQEHLVGPNGVFRKFFRHGQRPLVHPLGPAGRGQDDAGQDRSHAAGAPRSLPFRP